MSKLFCRFLSSFQEVVFSQNHENFLACNMWRMQTSQQQIIHSNTSLEPDPFREVLADRTLQEVVDKIFPWMKTKEEQEEKDFYARRGIEMKPEYAEEVNSPKKKRKTGLETRVAVMANRNASPSGAASPFQVSIRILA